jgi:hypothetical protein
MAENFNLDDPDLLIEVLINLCDGESHAKYDKSGDCDICWEKLKGQYVLSLKCNHVFHRNCLLQNIIKYKREDCPSCENKS